jgi:hypothetical protein
VSLLKLECRNHTFVKVRKSKIQFSLKLTYSDTIFRKKLYVVIHIYDIIYMYLLHQFYIFIHTILVKFAHVSCAMLSWTMNNEHYDSISWIGQYSSFNKSQICKRVVFGFRGYLILLL